MKPESGVRVYAMIPRCAAMVELDYQTAMSEGQRERPCGQPIRKQEGVWVHDDDGWQVLMAHAAVASATERRDC